MSKVRRSVKNGQSIVEMALLLPILLLVSVVTFDLGRGIYYYSVIYNAAREGARYGIIRPNNITEIKDRAINMAVGVNLDTDNVTITPDPPDPNVATIRVSISYDFQLVTPIARLFLPCSCDHLNLQASSTMYVER